MQASSALLSMHTDSYTQHAQTAWCHPELCRNTPLLQHVRPVSHHDGNVCRREPRFQLKQPGGSGASVCCQRLYKLSFGMCVYGQIWQQALQLLRNNETKVELIIWQRVLLTTQAEHVEHVRHCANVSYISMPNTACRHGKDFLRRDCMLWMLQRHAATRCG